MFVDEVFKGRDYITHEDFVEKFEGEIISARANLANQASLNLTAERSVLDRTMTAQQLHQFENNYHMNELKELLGQMIIGGHAGKVMQELIHLHDPSVNEVKRLLTNSGLMVPGDAHKVTETVKVGDRVDSKKLQKMIDNVREYLKASSDAIRKIKTTLEKHARFAVQ